MCLHTSNTIALARTQVGVALDESMTDDMREPLREIITLLNSKDIDASASLLDDTISECFDPMVKDHLLTAYSYLQDISWGQKKQTRGVG